jgi:hypothetical protein
MREAIRATGVNPDKADMRRDGVGGLDAIAEATVGMGKTSKGGGKEAPRWFREGQFAKLYTYCGGDVMATRDLAEFIRDNGHIISPRKGRVTMPPMMVEEEV